MKPHHITDSHVGHNSLEVWEKNNLLSAISWSTEASEEPRDKRQSDSIMTLVQQLFQNICISRIRETVGKTRLTYVFLNIFNQRERSLNNIFHKMYTFTQMYTFTRCTLSRYVQGGVFQANTESGF